MATEQAIQNLLETLQKSSFKIQISKPIIAAYMMSLEEFQDEEVMAGLSLCLKEQKTVFVPAVFRDYCTRGRNLKVKKQADEITEKTLNQPECLSCFGSGIQTIYSTDQWSRLKITSSKPCNCSLGEKFDKAFAAANATNLQMRERNKIRDKDLLDRAQ